MIKKSIKKSLKTIQAVYNYLLFCQNDLSKIKTADVVFVLPCYQTGGAERVHLDIVKSVKDKSVCILFTQNSATDNFKKDFSEFAEIIEINTVLNKKNHFINEKLKRRILKTINSSLSIKSVFSSNTNYFYELLPEILNENIVKVDLIHAISGENPTLENLYVNSSEIINHRLVINNKTFQDVVSIYNNANLEENLQEKIAIVENGITFKDDNVLSKNDKIKIGFVGRWSKEKRPEIFLKIASRLKQTQMPVEFIMAGIGMESNIHLINENGISFEGEITNDDALTKLYKSLTFILITSSREGFPMVIIEAMANGVIPICTDVGGISEHISSYQNGVLIADNSNEDEIVDQFIKEIENILKNKSVLSELSLNAYDYSKKHFDIKVFNKKYRKYLLNEI